jgi:hypothetical protein
MTSKKSNSNGKAKAKADPFGDDKQEKEQQKQKARLESGLSVAGTPKLIHSLVVGVGDGVEVGYVEGCALNDYVFVVDL